MSELYESFTGGNFSNDFKDTKWYGMTFTPQASHVLTSVKLYWYRVGSPGTVYVSLRATDGTYPITPDLDLTSMSSSLITTSSPGTWYEMAYTGGITLNQDTMYAFVMRCSGNSSNFLQYRFQYVSGTYARGRLWYSPSSGVNGSWTNEGGQNSDGNFMEYGDLPGLSTSEIKGISTANIAEINGISLANIESINDILVN